MPSLLCSSTPIGCWSSSPAPIAWSTCGPISSSVLSCTAAYRWRRAVMPEEGALISFRSVSFAYPGAVEPAVREVTLEVRDGEMLAVVGANGSGKSTLGRLAHPLELSTSDRARLGLAGAVIGDPRYLIMDEATAYLDAADRAALLQAVQELRAASGMGVVLITHLMDEALAADRVAVLAGGALVFVGSPRTLFADR